MDRAVSEKSSLLIRRLAAFDPERTERITAEDFLFDAPGIETVADACAGIVVATGGAERAMTLLAVGAPFVFLGDAALSDSDALTRLAQAHPGRIGIHALARRMAVSWSFETASNADFKTVAPSLCEPSWEILKSDGAPTGVLAGWWLKAMQDLGAMGMLVRAEVCDDTDLNILAGLSEEFGDLLWVAPLNGMHLPLADWVVYGHGRRLALPDEIHARRAELLGDFMAAAR